MYLLDEIYTSVLVDRPSYELVWGLDECREYLPSTMNDVGV